MKHIATVIISAIILMLIASCGGKPGGLMKPEDMVAEFTKRLNMACTKAEYDDLLKLFDKNAKVLIQTEFNPELHQGLEKIRGYFSAIPLDTKFEIGEVRLSGLQAETRYSFIQKNGVSGSGVWKFKINNMGRIGELAIIPGIE